MITHDGGIAPDMPAPIDGGQDGELFEYPDGMMGGVPDAPGAPLDAKPSSD